MHVYNKAKITKNTWLQACFLGDVEVIWYNSLGDSHFQIYVMNNVEIVIDCYLLITSHVSHAVTSYTHFTSYSLLNLVHEIVCEFGLAIQDYIFYDFDTKYVHWLKIWGQKVWKTFKLILMHFIHEIIWIECFLHKLLLFFKKSCFLEFRSIKHVFWSIENPLFFKDWSRLVRLVPDWYSNDRISKGMKKKKKLFHLTCSSLFQIFFFLFHPFLSRLFCHFPPQIFKGFCPQVWVRPKYPSFFNLFTFFMHFSHYFWTKDFWGFWFLGCFCSNLLIGFLFLDDIYMIPMH